MAALSRATPSGPVTLFLCGDVMTGRGIDQLLPHPGKPQLFESYVRDARDYVSLAEATSGRIPVPVDFEYIWGAALDELARVRPAVRLINLETAITRHETPWPHKGINYRMHPDNAPCLQAAGIHCCALANNHVLDWDYPGLAETCRVLDSLDIRHAGAGSDERSASRPAVIAMAHGCRLLVWSIGLPDSGIPRAWRAGPAEPGVWLMPEASADAAGVLGEQLRTGKRRGDIAVVSVHWGSNWGFEIPAGHRRVAHHLIDCGADVVHGHSSHHPRTMELYRGRPILYGCGDFINDYEGIGGHETFRPDLALMYFLRLLPGGRLQAFWITPLRRTRLTLKRATHADTLWLQELFARHRLPGTPGFRVDAKGSLHLRVGHPDC